jgi:hypothetical protein
VSSAASNRAYRASFLIACLALAAFDVVGCHSVCPRGTKSIGSFCKTDSDGDAAVADGSMVSEGDGADSRDDSRSSAAAAGGTSSAANAIKANSAGSHSAGVDQSGSSLAGASAGIASSAGGAVSVPPAGHAGPGSNGGAGSGATQPMAHCGNGVREGSELCDGDCPTSCASSNDCVPQVLVGSASSCDAQCTLHEITECAAGDRCCPTGCTHATDNDCSSSCGDGVVDENEKCEPNSTDRPCPSVADCDDNDSCTVDMFTGSASACSAQCAHMPITRAGSSDGCCPKGADATSDVDCEPKCGNGVVEPGETCDGSCPRSCDDGNPCTTDSLQNSGCKVACINTRIGTGTANACGGCNALPHPKGGSCSIGTGECADSGMYECAGSDDVTCQPTTTTRPAERCDGADNDCDGVTDEDAPCAAGTTCKNGSCIATLYQRCTTDSDCGSSEYCAGFCTQRCSNVDATGPASGCSQPPGSAGVTCSPRSGSTTSGACVVKCAWMPGDDPATVDCPKGLTCLYGLCAVCTSPSTGPGC